MERSEILEALATLNQYFKATRHAGGVVGADVDEAEDALDTLNAAHEYDPREPWWEQV